MKVKDILIAMCGVDENDEAKSQVMIETKYLDVVKGEENTVDSIQLHGPVVNCFRSNRFMNVDLRYDSASDPHLLETILMLKKFCTPENSMNNDDGIIPMVQLYILPLSLGGEYYATGVDAAWTVIPSQMNQLPDTIRFTFIHGDFNVYRINESEIDVDSLEGSIENGEENLNNND